MGEFLRDEYDKARHPQAIYSQEDPDPNDRPRPKIELCINWKYLIAPIPWILLAIYLLAIYLWG